MGMHRGARHAAVGALLGAMLATTACGERTSTPSGSAALAAAQIEADVRFLADDLLEGRAAGTRGYDLAARYVASRMQSLGLQPAGSDGGYLQPVPLLRGERLAEGARFAIERDGRTVELVFAEQFLPTPNYLEPDWQVGAPLVFVGQAVHAPALGHDDFAGLDLRGRIAVALANAPARFPDAQRAFHASRREKAAAVAARGAIGLVLVGDPASEQRSPWAARAANWARPGMRLLDADGAPVDVFPGLRAGATVSAAAATALFAGAPMEAEAVFAALAAGTLRGFELPGRAVLAGRTRLSRLHSHNVVGRLPGSDPALAAEHVVYTAHLDHVGVGAPVDGDAIHNGALDNALGVGVMLAAARQLGEGPAPRRSLLFVAVTAEEQGLLGASHFVRSPTVPAPSLVANINLDMPVLLGPQADVVAIGIEHSTLRAPVAAAAEGLGIPLGADPAPAEVAFIRSDQYAFIRAGIPAVYLTDGVAPVAGAADPRIAREDFLRGRYHRPGDEATLPIHYSGAVRLAMLAAAVGREVGNARDAPRWNEGDFFGDRFGAGAPASR